MTAARRAVLLLGVSVACAAAVLGGSASSPGATPLRAGHATAAKPPPAPGSFLRVNRRAHAVTITLIASYNGVNSGFNFDGYSRFLMFTVPRGWTVHVVCQNRGPLRHSCAVVQNAGTAKPAFRHAETPQPFVGIEAGTTVRFTFRASRPGVYRFVCLVPGHEQARMWDVLDVVRHGKPSAVNLQGKA